MKTIGQTENTVSGAGPVDDNLMLNRIREAQDRHQCGRATPMDEAFLAGEKVRRFLQASVIPDALPGGV